MTQFKGTLTQAELDAKQATLVSGTSIKTVGGASLLGSGNVSVTPTSVASRNWDENTDASQVALTRTLHLRADSLTVTGPVASWTAIAGTAAENAVVANQPDAELAALGTHNLVNFNGTSDTLSTTTATTTIASAATVMFLVVGKGAIGINNGTLIGSTTSSCLGFSLGGGAADTKMRFAHHGVQWLTAGTTAVDVTAGVANILGGTWDASTDALAYYLNGLADGTGTYAGTISATGNIAIGAQTGTNFLNMKLAEVLLYPGVLSAVERAKVEGAWAWKYGIQAKLPAGHTYKNAAPSVLDIPSYADNAAALAASAVVGSMYRTNDMMQVVHTAAEASIPTFNGSIAHITAGQDATSAVTKYIDWGTTSKNSPAYWASGTANRFTALTAGVYQINARVKVAGNTAGYRELIVNKNAGADVSVLKIAATLASDIVINGTILMDLAVNDYIRIGLYQDSGSLLQIRGSASKETEVSFIRIGD